MAQLERGMENTKLQLARAERLVSGLGTEEKRWAEEADRLADLLQHVVGNMILAAGLSATGVKTFL